MPIVMVLIRMIPIPLLVVLAFHLAIIISITLLLLEPFLLLQQVGKLP